jgi:hypothetical protein
MRKAQAFSYDLIVGLSIALVVFAMMFGAWAKATVRINEHTAYEDMTFRAMLISEVLVKDSALGLVGLPYELDNSKVDDFVDENYDVLRNRFNIKPNGFYLAVKINDSVVKSKGTEASGESVASVRRAVVYNGTGAVLEFRIKEE